MHGKIDKKAVATEMAEGAGARVRRLFPGDQIHDYDPFVLLDEFFVSSDAGFPPHPHKGFEAYTFMLEGAFRHSDNLGNDQQVGPGGVQRFSAGSGITHAELPGKSHLNHGFQLWVNLPREHKSQPPDYQKVTAEAIPKALRNGVEVTTIVGEGSPVKHLTEMIYLHLRFGQNTSFELQLPESMRGFAYLHQGALTNHNAALKPQEAVLFDHGEKVYLHASEASGCILLAGVPYNQPIVIRGSFVL